jgi:acetoin utilization deacetylase AcuC-like enzyme
MPGCFYDEKCTIPYCGERDGLGYNVNIPLAYCPNKYNNDDFNYIFHHIVIPIIKEFNPQLMLVACGFDACIGDPIGDTHLTPEWYYHMTKSLMVSTTMSVIQLYIMCMWNECNKDILLL